VPVNARGTGVAVTGTGARGPLGLNALQIATATRAFLLEPRPSPFLDARGGRAGLAYATSIDPSIVGFDRYVALGAPALREASPRTRSDRRGLPLVLALPDRGRPDQIDSRFEHLVRALGGAAGVALDLDRSEIVRAGHAGFAAALRGAMERVGAAPGGVLVGAIDSPVHPDVPRWLDERGHLMRVDHEDDVSRIPGEAAAFLRLELGEPRSRGGVAWVRVAEVESDVRAPDADRPKGREMGRLLRRVARAPASERLAWVLSDVNGERDRTEAWLAAEEEARDVLSGAARSHLVERTSDVGAATGALLSIIAITWARIGAIDLPNVAICTSADGPERGVCVFDLPERGGRFVATRDRPGVRHLRVSPLAVTPNAAERLQMARSARGCLEEMGSMSLLMRPFEGEPPDDQSERIFESLDALGALGVGVAGAVFEPRLLEIIESYAAESEAGNRARTFAVEMARAHLRAHPSGTSHTKRSAPVAGST
jgi:3-oxoacyl-[acyl-carrier-protein] synthase-1